MFTGLVEALGTIKNLRRQGDGLDLTIAAPFAAELTEGESVAINGCCLTVTTFDSATFSVYASSETLDKTNIGGLTERSRVNLERALRLDTRLGGHIVQGHVDGRALLRSREQVGPGEVFVFDAAPELLTYLVPKGSVCIDGISLTVNGLTDTTFDIYAIPHTLSHTTLPDKSAGASVNIEVDVLAKYVERFVLKLHSQSSSQASKLPTISGENQHNGGLGSLLEKSGFGQGS